MTGCVCAECARRGVVCLQVRARFVERFSMGAPFAGGEVRGPVIKDMSDRVSWVEKFVRVGSAAQTEAQAQQQQQQQHSPAVSAAACRVRVCVTRVQVANCGWLVLKPGTSGQQQMQDMWFTNALLPASSSTVS